MASGPPTPLRTTCSPSCLCPVWHLLPAALPAPTLPCLSLFSPWGGGSSYLFPETLALWRTVGLGVLHASQLLSEETPRPFLGEGGRWWAGDTGVVWVSDLLCLPSCRCGSLFERPPQRAMGETEVPEPGEPGLHLLRSPVGSFLGWVLHLLCCPGSWVQGPMPLPALWPSHESFTRKPPAHLVPLAAQGPSHGLSFLLYI